MNPKPHFSLKEVIQKLEYYCSYQERCHAEVYEKLYSFDTSQNEKEEVIVHLIQNNFLNEERFALLFSISKLHQKKWGKIRITQELKARKISAYLINKAITSLPIEEYYLTFHLLSEHHWEFISEKNKLKKRKKFCDYLLRKGWESDLVYSKAKEMEIGFEE